MSNYINILDTNLDVISLYYRVYKTIVKLILKETLPDSNLVYPL